MRNDNKMAPVAVAIEDLHDIVGGAAFVVSPLLEIPVPGLSLESPGTAPQNAPVFSTCMCVFSPHDNCGGPRPFP